MLKKSLPLLLIIALTALFIGMGWHEYLSFEQLREHRLQLNDWVSTNPFIAPLVFILVYIAVVAFSLPGDRKSVV